MALARRKGCRKNRETHDRLLCFSRDYRVGCLFCLYSQSCSRDLDMIQLMSSQPPTTVPNPLVAPLRDARYLVDRISDVSGVARHTVIERLQQEHKEEGVNVQVAMQKQSIAPYVWSDRLIEFYNSTDAFLYETTIWNRSRTKNTMRKFIAERIQRAFPKSARVMLYGDGLGFDSLYLAEAGYQVDYFDSSLKCAKFAKQLVRDFEPSFRVVDNEEAFQNEHYDVVVCLDVLEHVPSPEETVAFLASLLRTDGLLIVHAPYWFLAPEVSTHLVSNRKHSGSSRLYRYAGLRPVDAQWFWNPLVLQKSTEAPATSGLFRANLGGLLLSTARFWAWPHVSIWRWIARRQWQPWPELEDLADTIGPRQDLS